MEEQGLSEALARAENALERVEQALARLETGRDLDDELRARVREAVAELDQMIRTAGD